MGHQEALTANCINFPPVPDGDFRPQLNIPPPQAVHASIFASGVERKIWFFVKATVKFETQ
jgi:hypothetical protein